MSKNKRQRLKTIKKQAVFPMPTAVMSRSILETNVDTMAVAEAQAQYKSKPFGEVGSFGVPMVGGIMYDDFQEELKGDRAISIYKEMSQNDSVIGAILNTLQTLFGRIDWIIDTPKEYIGVPEAEKIRDLISDIIFEDMGMSFDDFISDVLSMWTYGYSIFEKVYKLREDGYIGLTKLGFRPQDTKYKWDITNNGEILAFEQQDPNTGEKLVIPYEKCLHFTTVYNKGNPEGRSLLRNVYNSWYYAKQLIKLEAIGYEKDRKGTLIVGVPAAMMGSTDPADQAAMESYKRIARDLHNNEQAGVVIPSDTYLNEDGSVSNIPKVYVKLLTENASGYSNDMSGPINRHQQDKARALLADYIMLGSNDKGSYALADSKKDIFIATQEYWIERVTSVINRNLIKDLVKLNGLNEEYTPVIRAGSVYPLSIDTLASILQRLGQSGFPLYPDTDLENYVREQLATLMPKPQDEIEESRKPPVSEKFVDARPNQIKDTVDNG